MLALPPLDAAHSVIANEIALDPDAVLEEPAPDAAAEGREIGVVEEHHGLAKRLLMAHEHLVEHDHAENHADGESHAEVRRLNAGPRQERASPTTVEADVVEQQPRIGDEEAGAERK